jgi:hypothetical protein
MTVAEQAKAERDLGEILNDYAGQWVAVRDYDVIAHADSLEELLGQIEGEGEGTLVLQVAKDKDVACFF